MIRFNQVTKQFGPESYGARELTFEVEPGEFVLITGPSGAGKTTIMRLLTKEYTPSEGSIFFEDTDLEHIPYSQVHNLRRKIGVVFQDYRLLPELNVWENIALPLSIVGQPEPEIEERVTDLLRLIELPEKAELFPSQLSGGEAQRVSIARALAIGPNVIFADEPTGNLDAQTSHTIGKLLKKINELGTTVLFATHDPSIIDLFKSHRHLHMDQGALVKDSQKPSSKKADTSDKKEKKEKQEVKKEEEVLTETLNSLEETEPQVQKQGFWSKLFGKKVDSQSDSQEKKKDKEIKNEDEAEANEKKVKKAKQDEKSSKDKKKVTVKTESL